MTKAALESAMLLNISFGQDIIVAGCYREYFPDTNHEIISSEKKEILYLFENVTLPEDPDCNKFFGNSLVGDGYLQGTYKSFLDVYDVIKGDGFKTWDNEGSYKYILTDEQKAASESSVDNEMVSELIEASSGTGFAISYSGHVVTGHHVIEACEKIKIHNNNNVVDAIVVASDIINDLVILKSEIKPTKVLSLSKEIPELLQEIYVAGFPYGKKLSSSLTINDGVISNLSGAGDNLSNITIDASMQPGNSGGPIVLKKNGDVVGIAIEKLDANDNTNFGVKSRLLINLLESKEIEIASRQYSRNLSGSAMVKLLNETTYYITCEMTMEKDEI